jgi:hypothetical protein
MAVNDILEESWNYSSARVAQIDTKFRSKGILQLSELRRRYSRQFRRILKKGKISNDSEYYFVQGILASFTADANEAERRLLEDLSATYEARAGRNHNHQTEKGKKDEAELPGGNLVLYSASQKCTGVTFTIYNCSYEPT